MLKTVWPWQVCSWSCLCLQTIPFLSLSCTRSTWENIGRVDQQPWYQCPVILAIKGDNFAWGVYGIILGMYPLHTAGDAVWDALWGSEAWQWAHQDIVQSKYRLCAPVSRCSYISLNFAVKYFAWLLVGFYPGPAQSSVKDAWPSGSMTMGDSGGQLMVEGLDAGRARKDGRVLITVGNRNISRSSIPSRETSCTASFSLHSLGISSAVMINVGILSKMVRTADLYAYC